MVAHVSHVLNTLLREVGGGQLLFGHLRSYQDTISNIDGARHRKREYRDCDQGLKQCEAARTLQSESGVQFFHTHRSLPRIITLDSIMKVCVFPGATSTFPLI